MNKPDYLISTPENVDLHLELAGLGNRILAALLDHVLIVVLLIAVAVVCLATGATVESMPLSNDVKTVIYWWLLGIAVVVVFVVNFGYFIYFEGTWSGQTPGKKALGIQVVEMNGAPVGWTAVWIRNLLRIVDELPGLWIGILPMMADVNERRFGDFGAGTLVIRLRAKSLSESGLHLTDSLPSLLKLDVGLLKPEEYSLLITFFKRRHLLTPGSRQRLASDLAKHFRTLLAVEDSGDRPESFLEQLVISYKDLIELDREDGIRQ